MTVLMDVVVVVIFAITMLVVHSLTDSAASHGSASTATVLGLFGAQARTRTWHAHGTLMACPWHAHGMHMGCTWDAHRTVHRIPSTAYPPDGSTHYGSTHYGSTHYGYTHYGYTHYGYTHHGYTTYSLWQMVLSVVVGLLLGLTIHAFIRCTRCAAPAAPPMGGAASPAASVMVSAVGAAPRRAATLTSLWLGAKLALVAAESCAVQLLGFEVFQAEHWETNPNPQPQPQPSL